VVVVVLAGAVGVLFISAHSAVAKWGGDSSSLSSKLFAIGDPPGNEAEGLSQACRTDPSVVNNMPD
jgi:hypothetical protein